MPSPEVVKKALDAIKKRSADYEYFFDKLNSPEWIKPLWDAGLFSHPPEPLKDGQYVRFPIWPESRYLARMASLEPNVVLKVIQQIPDTENVRVFEDLIDAALKMPVELGAQLVEKAKNWARSPYQLLMPEKLGLLVAHLAKGGQVDSALSLAQALLEVLPDPKVQDKSTTEELYRLPPEPRARFDIWDYEQILKKDFPELVRTAEIRAVNLLCNFLEAAIRLSRRRDDDEGPEDYSWIWRRAIEDHSQNMHHGLKDVLVSGIRDASDLIVKANTAILPYVVRLLEERPWRVFHRLALDLLRRFPSVTPDLVVARLMNRDLFNHVGLRHEYALLIDECFETLTTEQQQVILGWIEEGPDLETLTESAIERTGKRPKEEDIAKYKKNWQRNRLAWFKTHLPENWRQRYQTLVDECGEPEHPEFSSYVSTGYVGPTSPMPAKDIKTMPISELVAFLQTWQPPADHFAPSLEGLGRELTTVVAEDPTLFVLASDQFKDLDPTFVRAMIRGCEEACKANKTFDWSSVIELCRWITAQPRDISGRKLPRTDADPDWGWARKAVASLLSAGFDEKAFGIPITLRQKVWDALKSLTNDPDPTPEYEAQYGGSNMDPATLSINTTRGEAMHTVIRYALWARRHLEKLPNAKQQLAHGFAEMPEVSDVLDKHLDVLQDPSLAIRAIYGQWFPWLVLIDPAWASEHLDKIFPSIESERPLRDAAWETYILFCAPYDNVFKILRGQYALAIGRLGETPYRRRQLDDPHRHLAEHLMAFYWRGEIKKDDANRLLTKFWSKASGELRGHALEFVGRSLHDTQGNLHRNILERLKSLWEHRFAVAKQDAEGHKAEMAAFGWWFSSGKLEDAWAIHQLIEALKISGKTKPDHLVIKRLAALAQTMPKEAIQCLEAVVKGDQEGWSIYSWRVLARNILETALQSTDTEAATSAVNLVHYLGSRGYFEFRDLLQKKPS